MQLKGGQENTPLTYLEFEEMMAAFDLKAVSHLAVAVSGGADSLSLCFLLNEWCLNHAKKLTALIVDHGLRASSEEEAFNVKNWLIEKEIPCEILKWVGKKPDSNIQDQARIERYHLMEQWCQQNGIKHLFVAHHQDDQAETFLIRLFRGSGVDGLSAMEKVSELPLTSDFNNSVYLYRPLLDVPKSRLVSFLEKQQHDWVEDSSNQNEMFTRVQVRNLIKDAEIDGLNSLRLADTAKRMSRVRSLLDELTEEAESEFVKFERLGFVRLRTGFLNKLHEEISLRLLSRVIQKVSGVYYPPRYKKLEALFKKIKAQKFKGQTIAGVQVFLNTDEELIICREANAMPHNISINVGEKLLWDNRLIVRPKNHSGFLKPMNDEILSIISTNFPDIKEKLATEIGSLFLLKRVLAGLPVLELSDKTIMLPDILFAENDSADYPVFSAVFKK